MQREQTSIPKMLLYIILVMLVYAVQSSLYGTWSIGGYHIDLMPSFVASAAMLGGPVEGLIVGITVGVFYDLGFVGTDGLYPIFFMLFGLVAGALSKLALSRSYVSLVLMNIVEMVLLGYIRYFAWLLPRTKASFLLVSQQILGGTLLASLFCFVSYFPMMNLSRRFDNK